MSYTTDMPSEVLSKTTRSYDPTHTYLSSGAILKTTSFSFAQLQGAPTLSKWSENLEEKVSLVHVGLRFVSDAMITRYQ